MSLININSPKTYFGAGDIQKSLTKLPGFPWAKYKGEKHLPGHNYTGPGTRLDLRLDENDNPKLGEEPVNRVDAAALKHDKLYRNEDLQFRHEADKQMIQELESIPNPTFREKVERALIIRLLKSKMKLGMGLADEIHKEFRKTKNFLKVKVFAKDDIWSADLINMPLERGYKYCLTVIDLYTRFAWVIPLKNKTGLTVKKAFETIMKHRKPKKLWVDQGTEFYNKNMKSLGFEIYSTYNEGKAVVIERFNRTLKNKLFKKFTELNSQKWLKILPIVVDEYNNKIHSSIKVTPTEASKNPDIIKSINTQNNFENENLNIKLKFKVGDRVRIYKYKSKFEKGYIGYWTNEIFIIDKVNKTSPPTYSLVDLHGEEILGRFYQNELQKTDF